MTNTRTTKRALLTSTMALFLCFAMLLGTTYAWFTDSVTSDNNLITAGNLDIELYHKDGELTKEEKVDSKTTLFDDIALWEPGAVVYETFRVANEGDLALKYQLSVNVTNATENANGDTLADVLKVGVIEDGTKEVDRKNMIGEVKEWKSLETFTLHGNLAEKKDKTYTVVIYWEPSENDNDYNMNNNAGQTLLLNIGVTLLATQYTAENDSFNNEYDEDAWVKGMKVYTASDLQAAINAGETNIKLMDDITLGEAIVIRSATPAIVIDLNGKTITGNVGRDADGNRVHVIVNNGNAVIKNGVITSAGVNGGSAIYNADGATLTVENVTLNGAPQEGSIWPSYTVNNYGTLTVSDSSIYGVQGIIATNNTANTTVNNVIAYRDGWSSGHVFYTPSTGKVTINGGTYTNDGNGVDGTMIYGGETVVNGGTFIVKEGAYFALCSGSKLTVNGGDFSNIKSCLAWGGAMTISGGTFGFNPTTYVADGYHALSTGGKYYVVPDSVNTVIATAEDLVNAFANLKADDVLYIAADLDMTNKSISPVTGNKGFTMYGNGYTISNLNTTEPALFVAHSGSSSYTFDEVVLENCSVNSTTNYGALFVGDGDTSDAITIKNCVVKNCTVESVKYAAAFVAYTAGYNVQNNGPVYSDVLVENCSVIGGSITGGGSVGAAIGHAGGNVDTTTKVENLTVDGVVIFGEDAEHTGIVVGTANVGKTFISRTDYTNVTGNHNGIYGRFVPGTTGTLVIDGSVYVATAEALAAALTANEQDISVILTADIDLPISSLGQQTGGSGEYKLGGSDTEKITIDLNGKKLNITTTYMSAIGAKNADATITIKNGSMSSQGNSATTWNINDLIFANCNYVFENVTFDKEVALTNTGKKVTMNNVTINGTGDYYALWIQAEGQQVTIDDLTINTVGRGIKIDEQYSNENVAKVTLTVSDATFNTLSKAAIMVKSAAGADINLTNVDITNVAADPIHAVWVDEDAKAHADKVIVTGGNKIVEGAVVYVTSKEETGDVAAAQNINTILESGSDVILGSSLNLGTTVTSNGAGATGIKMAKGGTFDGNGKTLSVPAAGGTWDSALSTNGGTIKNLTIDAGFRGIFVTAGGSKVYLDKVKIEGSVYTISCDSASGHGLEATNSTFNGWTSYAGTIGNVKFTDCNFGEGAGYAFCRPYAPTEFVNCNFEAGFVIDARAAITLENCYLDGVLITAENIATLVVYNTGNAQVK